MLTLATIGSGIAKRRKTARLSQVDALENGRAGELGFSKISKILAVLGLELRVEDAKPKRPTLDELLTEDRDDKGVDRRR
jgi:hypothetical protein